MRPVSGVARPGNRRARACVEPHVALIQRPRLSRALSGVPVSLINDLAATAYGVIHLKSVEVAVLHRAENPPRAREYRGDCGGHRTRRIGAGVGHESLPTRSASEGGHTDFRAAWRGANRAAAISRGRIRTRQLRARSSPVPDSRTFTDSCAHASHIAEPAWLSEQIAAGDHAAAVSEAALAGTRILFAFTPLSMFCDIYGSEGRESCAQDACARRSFSLGGGYRAEDFADADGWWVRESIFVQGAG